MPELRIQLAITPEQFVEWYRGTAKFVVVRSLEGPTVQFPAAVLQRFITPTGIRGTFLLRFDDANHFLGIERVGPP